MDKFVLHYWSPEEIIIYNQFFRKEKQATLTIDATGSVANKNTMAQWIYTG